MCATYIPIGVCTTTQRETLLLGAKFTDNSENNLNLTKINYVCVTFRMFDPSIGAQYSVRTDVTFQWNGVTALSTQRNVGRQSHYTQHYS